MAKKQRTDSKEELAKNVIFTAYIPLSYKERLAAIAQQEDRKVSTVLRRILDEHFRRLDQANGGNPE